MSAIDRKDIITDGAFKAIEDMMNSLKALNVVSEEVLATMRKMINEGVKSQAGQTDLLAKVNDEKNKIKETNAQLVAIEKQITAEKNKSNKAYQDQNRELTKLRTLNSERQKQIKQEARDQLGLTNAYDRLTKSLSEAQRKYKDLAASQGINSNAAKAQQRVVEDLDKKVKVIDASAGQFQRNVGNYPKTFQAATSSLKGFLGAFGIIGGVALFAKVMTNVVKLTADYEAANSKLQAVLGISKNQMGELRAESQRLGATTAFTASQVTELQTELAKLGFTVQPIKEMTASILDGAKAMGSGLAETAKLAGATLKAFGLPAKQASRVMDVLAKSTSISALDFEKLSGSMSTIAPVAKKFGFELEDTVALLGQLSDAGFDASSAATATRNILLNLADSNGKLAKSLKEPVKDLPSLIRGLKQLKGEGTDLGKALELTSTKSVSAFATFLEDGDAIERMGNSLRNSAGAAREMAAVMGDNLKGDVTILKSAWEGFILSLTAGEGVFGKVSRAVVQLTTSILNFITPMNEASRAIKDEQQNLNVLATRIMMTNDNQEKRNELIRQIQKEYPDLLGNIRAESVTNELLAEKLQEVNKQYIMKIALAMQEEKIQKNVQKQATTANRAAAEQVKFAELIATANQRGAKIQISSNDTLEQSIQKVNKARKEGYLTGKEALNAQAHLEFLDMLKNSYEEQSEIAKQLEEDYQKLESALNVLLGIKQKDAEITEDQTESMKEAIDVNKEYAKSLLGIKNVKLREELEALRKSQALLNAEFDRTGDTKIKEELDAIAAKMGILNNAIAAGDIAFQMYSKMWDEFYKDEALKQAMEDFNKSLVPDDKAVQQAIDNVMKAFKEPSFFELATMFEPAAESSEDVTEKIKQDWKDAADYIKNITRDLTMETIATVQDGFDVFTERRIAGIDANILKMEEEKERTISLYEEGSDQRAIIEERYNARIEALEKQKIAAQRKRAIFEKALSVAQIFIKTRQAVMTTVAQLGGIAAAPFIPYIIGLGAVQAGLALAQPIPAYFEGTDSAQKGLGTIAEFGPEIREKNGKMELFTKPTLTNFVGGEKVFNHEDTAKMILNGLIFKQETKRQSEDQAAKEIRRLRKDLLAKPSHIINGHVVGSYVNGTKIRKIERLRNK
jgi:TP901 family phage tail tape measure protein